MPCIQPFQYLAHITDDTAVHQDIFVDLCRIHIDLNNLCIFCKALCLSHNTVAESGTD